MKRQSESGCVQADPGVLRMSVSDRVAPGLVPYSADIRRHDETIMQA